MQKILHVSDNPEHFSSIGSALAQIPANINEETIPKMQSLPEVVKREITEVGITSLSYQNQICKFDNGDITYYTPTGDEIFANDWETKSDDALAEWENI